MKPEPTGAPSIQFNFLDEKSKKEPYIVDVLSEIYLLQGQSLPSGEKPLATLEHLQNSRSINIPYTTARNRNIEYLVEHLLRIYPAMVKTVTTYSFSFDEESKKLGVIETVEYTVMLSDANFRVLQDVRDRRSLENLLAFIGRFRIINLSKILKKSLNKAELSRIIKMELGKTLFTFKSYRVDRNRIEYAEDYCFHAKNYDRVKETLNFKKLKEMVEANSDLVMRRLKKYGIMSPDTSDYRDSKLEYIQHIFLDDLGNSLPESDLVEMKNFKALRNCLLKVDTILDPALTLGTDIVKLVRENAVCTAGEITAALPEVTPELLDRWKTPENLAASRVMYHVQDDTVYFIDGSRFFANLIDLSQKVVYSPEKLNLMAYQERQATESRMDIFTRAAKNLVSSEETALKMLNAVPDTLEKIRVIINDYEGKKVQQAVKKDHEKIEAGSRSRRSLWRAIIDFFKGLFGGGSVSEAAHGAGGGARREISPGTRRVYEKISDRNEPVIPLSDYIELAPENNAEIDRMIQDLRDHNLKVVVPVYSAREVLYPKRSRKLIIPDVEYLLLPPDVCRNPDEIRAFTDSLAGFKIKDDVMQAKAILSIEKYLLTVHRQKRAQQFKREL
jgi:hypothetical protein